MASDAQVVTQLPTDNNGKETVISSIIPPPRLDLLSADLFRVVLIILVFVSCLLVFGLLIQARSYWIGIEAVISVPTSANVDHAAVITYARGLGSAYLKTAALFFGFILIFTGSLYVLRTTQVAYELHVSRGTAQAALQTTSPGLVMVSLGVVLTIFALYSKTDIEYQQTATTNQEVPAAAPPGDSPGGPWIPAKASPPTQ